MFLHGGWDHILGNMLFLAIFGKNVEDAFGPLRYLVFYFAGGFVAMMTQTLDDAAVRHRRRRAGAEARRERRDRRRAGRLLRPLPELDACAALVVIFPVRLSAWFFLGAWFLYQLIEANFGLFGSAANGGGVAFFAHVGGFVFGYLIARFLLEAGRISLSSDPLGMFGHRHEPDRQPRADRRYPHRRQLELVRCLRPDRLDARVRDLSFD